MAKPSESLIPCGSGTIWKRTIGKNAGADTQVDCEVEWNS